MTMRETLAELRETAHSAVSKSPRVVAIVGVVLLLLTAGVAAQAVIETQTDDFEDQSSEGWVGYETGGTEYPTVVESPSQESGVGDYSLYAISEDTSGEGGFNTWRSGPVLDTTEGFNTTFTVRAAWPDSSERITMGLWSDQPNTEGMNALIRVDQSGDAYLATEGLAPEPEDSSRIVQQDFSQWTKVKFSASNSTVRLKMWAVGSTEPDDWQLEREFEGATGEFGFSVGTSQGSSDREVWLDSVTVSGELATDPSLSLNTRQLYQPGSTHEYTVRETRHENGQNRSYTVTDNATVESLNTSLLTVNDNNTLTATDNPNASATVLVRAQYNNSTTYQEVTVAEPTVQNMAILPSFTWRANAVLGDSFFQALLVALFIGVAVTRFTSAFGGIAGSQMMLTIGWFAGYVPWVYAALGLFLSLFIGLNLAANIDYTVRR